MKNLILHLLLLGSLQAICQQITVDNASFSPQELIADILIDSDCISNIVVTNALGGNFNGTDQSFGYFNANGSNFPFAEGIVMSTGRLQNTIGPNTSLSDDDAPGWFGDADLEFILNESNTTNATILEFDFTSSAAEISFRYLFASEEYQEGDPNTCRFSDLFGFLIRPIDYQRYTNIALVPDTQTPVKVTTVHPEIPGGCDAINEAYFDQFNGADVPINFNGQTTILTAKTVIIPNKVYHVKLVIADEQNFRFDSAVFLEAGSFKLNTDIGADRLISSGTALCENESITLDASQIGMNSYEWFKDGALLSAETDAELFVDTPGFYEVVVSLENNCESFGAVRVEYDDNPLVANTILIACDDDGDGRSIYNLYRAEEAVVLGNQVNEIVNFFRTEVDAIAGNSPIQNPRSFRNTIPMQTVFARVSNRNGCISIAEVLLDIATNTVSIAPQILCDDTTDGRVAFDLNAITQSFISQIPQTADVAYFSTIDDAISGDNQLSNPYTNVFPFSETIYVLIQNNNECYALSPVVLSVLKSPNLRDDDTILYCENTAPQEVTIESGVLNPSANYAYAWTLNGQALTNDTAEISVNSLGTYEVTVTAANGCSAQRSITVIGSSTAIITDVQIEGNQNATLTITNSGSGTYSYSLDRETGPFQQEPIFTMVSPGFHTIYVKDENGCGITQERIGVHGFPRYFTPNGDGIHDVFRVLGLGAGNARVLSFRVFDRFGKILHSERGTNQGWNGKLNGKVIGTNNFWYTVSLTDGRSFTGYFALIK